MKIIETQIHTTYHKTPKTYAPKTYSQISFKGEDSACTTYSQGFNSPENVFLRKSLFGEKKLAEPFPIKGIDPDKFHCISNMYGVGDLHIMLMPTEDYMYNFITTSANPLYGEDFTTNNIKTFINTCNKTNPKKQLYLFESGSSIEQLKDTKESVVQAHLHALITENYPLEEISKKFGQMSQQTIIKVQNKPIEELYEIIKRLSNNGKKGYKYIAKQQKNNPNLFDSIFFIEDNPKIPRKSQLTQSLFSSFIYKDTSSEYFDWKLVKKNINNLTDIMKKRVLQIRKNTKMFYQKLKILDLLR